MAELDQPNAEAESHRLYLENEFGERRQPTIDDIAQLTKVHRGTVSRALSRPDLVSVETRKKVEAAAQVLGYRMNAAARSLATGRSGLIGLIVPDSLNGFFNLILKASQHRARAAGLSVVLAETEYLPGTEVRAIQQLSQHVDGMICVSLLNSYESLVDAGQGSQMVFIGEPKSGFLSVAVDESGVMELGLDHLYSLGHRRIALVGGQPYFGSWEARRAYKAIWDERHPDCEVLEIPGFFPHLRDGQPALSSVLASKCTAVFAYSDALAIGMVLSAFTEGVRIPADLSILGCDDVPFASLVPDGLSTISLNVSTLGELAVDVLLGDALPQSHGPAPRLVVRGSTGPPRK